MSLGIASYENSLDHLSPFLYLHNIGVVMEFETPGLSKLVPFAFTHRVPIPCTSLLGSQGSAQGAERWACSEGSGGTHRPLHTRATHADSGNNASETQAGEKKTNKFAGLPLLPFASSS